MEKDITHIVYDTYRLKEGPEQVKLTATIGYGQDGDSVVKLNGRKVGEYSNQFVSVLGSNDSLHTKELRIASMVTDINSECDIVSIHIILVGGLETKSWTLFKRPTSDGQTYPLTATIGLYK